MSRINNKIANINFCSNFYSSESLSRNNFISSIISQIASTDCMFTANKFCPAANEKIDRN